MILSGRVVTVTRTRIIYSSDALPGLQKMLSAPGYRMSKIFILTDSNTRFHCLPVLLQACPGLSTAVILEIEGGDESKTLYSAEKLWMELINNQASRDSILINLGGGAVSDLGGFVAGGFKRGIRYVNIPTSLMGMVDAAIGGKTAVNLQQIKNQVGFFNAPEGIFIDKVFLKTLPREHLRSGFAEVIKSALIGDAVLWRKIRKQEIDDILNPDHDGKFLDDLIKKSVVFKNRIACQDFREKKLRKTLNFGHTFGHAFESLCSNEPGRKLPDNPQDSFRETTASASLLHGDAVALGMIAETWLSHMKAGLSEAEAREIITYLKTGYSCHLDILKARFDAALSGPIRLLDLMLHDKKNKSGQIIFTLLQSIAKPKVNVPLKPDEIIVALNKLFE
jgi:3-dehydroquinate synthase